MYKHFFFSDASVKERQTGDNIVFRPQNVSALVLWTVEFKALVVWHAQMNKSFLSVDQGYCIFCFFVFCFCILLVFIDLTYLQELLQTKRLYTTSYMGVIVIYKR